jgi:uncharacterized membrane protein YozB (DUF420 family)
VTRNAGEFVKRRAIIIGIAAFAVTVALVLAIKASGKADAGGFLGPGPLLADINLVLELLLVAGLTFGMFLARSGNIEAHRTNQTAWVLVNAALVLMIMASSIASFKIGSARALLNIGNAITVLHALAGIFTLLAGSWLVLQMNDLLPERFHVQRWKGLMRLTLAGYWAVALGGIATYYYWYAA